VQVASTPFEPRAELVAFCRERGIRVIAHSPLADARIFTDPTIAAVADAHDVGPASVALAYQVDRGVVPIPSSVDRDHLAANLAAGAITLTDAERAQLAGLAT
jgi:alcohol dehydrogenase (NADP+)